KAEYEELDKEQGALLKDLKGQLKDSEAALKAAEREAERLKGQLGKKEDLAERDSAITARTGKDEEREAKAQPQRRELEDQRATSRAGPRRPRRPSNARTRESNALRTRSGMSRSGPGGRGS